MKLKKSKKYTQVNIIFQSSDREKKIGVINTNINISPLCLLLYLHTNNTMIPMQINPARPVNIITMIIFSLFPPSPVFQDKRHNLVIY